MEEPFAGPPDPRVRHQLGRLWLTSAGVLASVLASLGAVSVLLAQRSEFSDIAPFGGWQVDAADSLVAAIALGIGVWSVRGLVRTFRRLSGRTSHRRLMILLAVLPGLGVGVGLAATQSMVVKWASHHTAAAAHERAALKQWLIDYRKSPLAAPSHDPAAPPQVAIRMLTTGVLGTGWYDMVRPNPVMRRVDIVGAPAGEVSYVASWLTRQHWAGSSWSLDQTVMESMATFSSRSAARSDVRAWFHPASACSCVVTPATALDATWHYRRMVVAGHSVWLRQVDCACESVTGAIFRVNNDVITLRFFADAPVPQGRTVRGLVRQAVSRATSS